VMELNGPNLCNVNPVQIVLDQYRNMGDLVVNIDKLQDILSALYENALNHGVLEMPHISSSSKEKDDAYQKEINRRISRLDNGFIRIELQQVNNQENSALLIKLEDSGRGFDHVGLMSDITKKSSRIPRANKSGIPLVRDLCHSLQYLGRGNRVEVILDSRQHSGIKA